jgi:hypothetical protein
MKLAPGDTTVCEILAALIECPEAERLDALAKAIRVALDIGLVKAKWIDSPSFDLDSYLESLPCDKEASSCHNSAHLETVDG